MTAEEEVLAFAEKHIPNWQDYITSQPVPAFRGGMNGEQHTWDDIFSGRFAVSEVTQRRVLRKLRDIFGVREAWGGHAL